MHDENADKISNEHIVAKTHTKSSQMRSAVEPRRLAEGPHVDLEGPCRGVLCGQVVVRVGQGIRGDDPVLAFHGLHCGEPVCPEHLGMRVSE